MKDLSLTQFAKLNLSKNKDSIILLASVEDAAPYLVGWDCRTIDNNLDNTVENIYTNAKYPFSVFITVRPLTKDEIMTNRIKIRSILSSL